MEDLGNYFEVVQRPLDLGAIPLGIPARPLV
jgi:hypothetical protein